MNFFDLLTLFGGLAMFLYGMRLMGDGLKEGSSGALKKALEGVTNSPIKAFLLGLGVTAVIQSSTATIVITSGLVAAGLISLHQSLGIIVGANVGTTVTGQIIRLLGVDSDAGSWLRIFEPSSLAPIALIIGIILIMGFKFKRARTIGSIAIGFGILFSGLLNMTEAVNSMGDTGIFDSLFSKLGDNPLIGYSVGALVAFILQSSSAAVGILQAFSLSGHLTFSAIYAVIVGIYLGDCVTTAIVCSIGARADAKRVGLINILFNLSKSAVVLIAVNILHSLGTLNEIWDSVATPGSIANANSIFNLGCALVLLPLITVYQRLSERMIRDDIEEDEFEYKAKLEALSPVFLGTPALALSSCYDALLTMFYIGRTNLQRALGLLRSYDEKTYDSIAREEDSLDIMTDRVSEYLISLSSHLTEEDHTLILNQYYKLVSEFERLGDHAKNIADTASTLHEKNTLFSENALRELDIMEDLITRILDLAEEAFKKRDVDSAFKIEPLEEVVDDMVVVLRENHMDRLSRGLCSILAGTNYIDVLADLERVSDICSNIGLATVTRVNPELEDRTHDYTYSLHSGTNQEFNLEYNSAREEYLSRISEIRSK